ncbi:mannose-1-phosphate guanyltransferase [Cenarchaeum symbiosum A]|uniref:Mannose-1-phosphate guanyltransferase n=1 Tax=Cenarchaeum symbiosum (strain A) TaxID=414004 RepID=A0RXP3_CENSY|nr:mannose-1-phosphate guanyltransferase [Cenarchaeum symbiosum A]
MKAVILAGGKGTRGKPYTEYIPKAMIPLEGRPVISYLVRFLESSDVDEIIILTDLAGHGGQIKNYIRGGSGSKKITYVQDSQSSTGGDLLHLAPVLEGESEFLLWFGDNLCRVDIAGMRRRYIEKDSLACVLVRTRRKEETGFAVVKDGVVAEFREKPEVELPIPECLGVYVLSTKLLGEIRALGTRQVNLSYDILEGLSKRGKVSAFELDGPWLDVESPVLLERNMGVASGIIRKMGL